MSRVILFIHGAGKFMSDYYREPLAALNGLLGTAPPCVGVWYADIFNIGSPVHIAPTRGGSHKEGRASGRRRGGSGHDAGQPVEPDLDLDEVTHFKMAFAMLVQNDLNSLPQYERRGTAAFAIPGQFLAELIATDLNAVAGYLFSSAIREPIQARVREGLYKAMTVGDEMIVVAHSLGSVAAFDVLVETGAAFKIRKFLTLGSPLAKLRRLKLRGPDLGELCQGVGEWLNLYDTTDPVANALGPAFPSRAFRLRDVFVDVDSDPIRSHDYFRSPETLAEIAGALI